MWLIQRDFPIGCQKRKLFILREKMELMKMSVLFFLREELKQRKELKKLFWDLKKLI